jgi:hypothetical protein
MSYLKDNNNNKSSSRLIGFIIIVAALFYVGMVLWFGRDNILTASVSAGVLFTTIAGPTMIFLFKQKETEKK